MHAENVVELQRGRNFGKKLCGIISETFAGPVDGLMGIVVKFAWIEAVSNDRVVVPQDDQPEDLDGGFPEAAGVLDDGSGLEGRYVFTGCMLPLLGFICLHYFCTTLSVSYDFPSL